MTLATAAERFTNLIVMEAIQRGYCPQCAETYLITFDDGLVYCPECNFEATVTPVTTTQNEDNE